MKFHKDGTLPTQGEIFVFGSNLFGIHGAGAAKAALGFGAKMYLGVGPCEQSYAIPTKENIYRSLPLSDIKLYVEQFIAYSLLSDAEFFVTAIGCGRAGYKHSEIAPMFRGAVNCSFPDVWQDFL